MTIMPANPFSSLVHKTLEATPVPELLQTHGAVVLERIARGAGATNWFYCADPDRLEDVEARLRPGSAVSFYFDDRIRQAFYSPETRSDAERLIAETGEVLFGPLEEDALQIDINVINGAEELAELTASLTPASRVFQGVFPARDNDGIAAVTVILPDSDGIVRPHPH